MVSGFSKNCWDLQCFDSLLLTVKLCASLPFLNCGISCHGMSREWSGPPLENGNLRPFCSPWTSSWEPDNRSTDYIGLRLMLLNARSACTRCIIFHDFNKDEGESLPCVAENSIGKGGCFSRRSTHLAFRFCINLDPKAEERVKIIIWEIFQVIRGTVP